MRIELHATAFDPWAVLAEHVAAAAHLRGRGGALATFVGTMRDRNDGDHVQGMRLEHYPGMTERELERIAGEAAARWPLLDVVLLHRVGELLPDDPIVLVAVWSEHRAAAFDACRFIMEALKSRAPFWKKERLARGERWVTTNTPGTAG